MSILKEVASPLLKSILPTVASAVGGPFAGIAVGWVAKKLLGKENGTLKEVEEFLSKRTPEQLLQDKIADQEFAAKMKELGVEEFKAEVDDRKSARSMAVASPSIAFMQVACGIIILVAFCVTNFLILSGSLTFADQNTAMIAGTVVGNIATLTGVVFAFLYGSTHGSQQKSEQMASVLSESVRARP